LAHGGSMAARPLRVGLAGLGVVGAGVVKLLAENADLVARRANRPIVVTAVSARDRSRERGVDLATLGWEDNAVDLAARDDVDAVVELIGGADGPALALAKAAIAKGKSFVTANKAMLAHHGLLLAQAAETAGVALKFEAAVGGGIPVIKGMREGLAANAVEGVYGILNGTCNYILTVMAREGRPFADVLGEAQKLGYAEADPTFDVDGIDAAHKLSILASLAFGTAIDFASVKAEGIRPISPVDIEYAREMGYKVKLVGMAWKDAKGLLLQRVCPCLVPLKAPLAHVDDAFNAVAAEGNFVGSIFFQGRGAGQGPTASAVVADLIDVARGEFGPAFAMPAAKLEAAKAGDLSAHVERFYLRLAVIDRPGVLAEIAAHLRDAGVSVQTLIQRGEPPEGGVYFVLTTHPTSQAAARKAADAIAKLDIAQGRPALLLPILDL
jgi:homoserine dehydrogenase